MGLSKEDQKNKYRLAGDVSFIPPVIAKSPKQKRVKKYTRISYKIKKSKKDTKLIKAPKTQILCLDTKLTFGRWKNLTIKQALTMGAHKQYFLNLINKYAFDVELLEVLK